MAALEPQHVGSTDWYYEYPTYCLIVHEVRDKKTGDFIRTDSIKIPWRMLKRSVERFYKPRKKPKPAKRRDPQ